MPDIKDPLLKNTNLKDMYSYLIAEYYKNVSDKETYYYKNLLFEGSKYILIGSYDEARSNLDVITLHAKLLPKMASKIHCKLSLILLKESIDSSNSIEEKTSYEKESIAHLYACHVLDEQNCNALIGLGHMYSCDMPYLGLKFYNQAKDICFDRTQEVQNYIEKNISPGFITLDENADSYLNPSTENVIDENRENAFAINSDEYLMNNITWI